jgi:rhomboid family GlyGly-CTERM serine protease
LTGGAARSAAWWAIAALLGAASVVVWLAPAAHAALEWRPELAWRQPWRAWSAAFVHLSALHLGANLLGLTLVALLGRAAGCGRDAARAWALAWPMAHLALAMQPALEHYGGLSGVLHAGVAVAVVQLLTHASGRPRKVGLALATGLAVKVLLESPWGPPTRPLAGWDFPVAPLAHATGALAGVLTGLAFVAMRRPPRLA